MSLLTSCPACGTVFKVKPEQLAPTRGDVRCGKCGQIFNALQSLSVTQPPQESTEAESNLLENESASEPEIIVAETDTASIPFELELPPPEPEPGPAPEPEPEPERKMVAPPPVFQPTVTRARKEQKRKRLPFWVWIPLCLLLVLFAIGQTLYFLRSEIAVWLPQTKPVLVQACALIRCTVDLPRNAQLLSIDDSDLQEHAEHKDVFVLSSTIVNRARYPQAYPLLELTLTDIHDRPILRRTLRPQEYLSPGTNTEIGLPPGGDVQVKVAFTAIGIAATGYRVYVSYP
jgi:predicted Zn finger-like uncharacterized protein